MVTIKVENLIDFVADVFGRRGRRCRSDSGEPEAKTRAERARIREIVKDIMTEIDIENKTENNVKTETKIDIKKTKAPSDHKDGLGRKWVLKEVNSENKA